MQNAEKRKYLLAEAEAYVMKKRADTDSSLARTKGIIDEMYIINLMMEGYNSHSNPPLSSEDFKAIITDIVNQMCRVENGN